jgi:nucleoside-diphosphate-sugar epimerase
MGQHVALVAGATGIIGHGVVQALEADPAWTARAVGRRDVDGVETVTVDLLDREATARALAGADATHLFFAAYLPQPDLQAEVDVNGPMLENLLAGLTDAPLRRVVLYQGAKVYGVHLGPVRAPFREDGPRHLPPNFYYTQEDTLRRLAAERGLEFVLLRPDVVVGDVVGNPMNIAMVIGAFAAISKATGTPFRFPGSAHVYEDVFAQVTDARLLGRASLYTALADGARNRAFNYVHAPFRWREVWTRVGTALGLEVAEPAPMKLATHMKWQAPVWDRIVGRHDLVRTPWEELVAWPFGDFVFGTDFDMVSDTDAIRAAGFAETIDSADAIIEAIRSLQLRRVLP